MPPILPSLKIDDDRALRRYFLPYQRAWIHDDAPLRLAEKSVRIGWTFADAFKNVRKRLRHPRRDYLFTTRDHSTALEYVRTCHRFAALYDFTRSIVSHGVEQVKAPCFDASGRATGFTQELKTGLIKFDNGSRILAFSSNPNALRAFGGDVGLDEFAFHTAPDQLWAAASGRVTWGYDLGVWSSCNGDQTLFHTFAREAEAGGLGGAGGRAWNYYRVTLLDAVEMGLVEVINRASGRAWTRAEFIEDCRRRARLPEVFEQEYLCQPRGSSAALVPWTVLEQNLEDAPIERLHLESREIAERFGAFATASAVGRTQAIEALIRQRFARLFASPARHALGFDVAASGAGDLAAICVDEREGDSLRLRALFTCRTEDWHFLKTALFAFLQHTPGVVAAGDETGLGRQICWEAAQAFGGRFLKVNFRSQKDALGFTLINQFTLGRKRLPRREPDVAADYFALRKTFQNGRWTFGEGANPLNAASHCDIAWAGALASHAAEQAAPPARIVAFPRKRTVNAAGRRSSPRPFP